MRPLLSSENLEVVHKLRKTIGVEYSIFTVSDNEKGVIIKTPTKSTPYGYYVFHFPYLPTKAS